MTAKVPSGPEKERELLLIFARNPEKGKVKTRLARTVGEENALQVYLELMEHTARTVRPLEVDKVVHYSGFLTGNDPLNRSFLYKQLQVEGDLGERMASAFWNAFSNGYERVVIIGTDCYELSTDILRQAFKALRNDQDVVMGPAADGGYYLMGMTHYIDRLFRNKTWGSSDVLLDSLVDLRELDLQYHLLPTLNDVDEEVDLGPLRGLTED